ncbi:hypothetical protein [Stutzerimonas nitrititolerans]|uniref:hypothetical protein n=1 Tax=Stutzerimonas nitrititolerans TaxID=2482751 RepID=UPI0028A0E9DF|nr:hypothetical protein [Stutzerimonas nitrititolerans]
MAEALAAPPFVGKTIVKLQLQYVGFKKMTPFSAVAQRVEGLRLPILALAKRHELIAH